MDIESGILHRRPDGMMVKYCSNPDGHAPKDCPDLVKVPLQDVPSLEQIEEWVREDGGCEATDGCRVEVDGTCPHGKRSWMLVLGLA